MKTSAIATLSALALLAVVAFGIASIPNPMTSLSVHTLAISGGAAQANALVTK